MENTRQMKWCLLNRHESKQIPKKLRHGFSWNEQQEKNLSPKWVGQGWTGAGYLGFFLPPWGG